MQIVGNLQAVVARQKAELQRSAESAKGRLTDKNDIIKWVTKYRRINGGPFSFEAAGPIIDYGEHDKVSAKLPRPYLLDFLRDTSQTRVITKCRQLEMTESHINEALFYCLTRPFTSWAHVFPTDAMGDDISNDKIESAISGSPRIAVETDKMAVRRYTFKTGSQYAIMGAYKKSGGRARSMDGVTYDEFDLMPESILGVFDALMDHSSLRLKRIVSTPTVPGVGIHGKYQSGSQAEWEFKCSKCKTVQTFSWPESCINYFEPSSYEPENPEYQKKIHKAYWGCRYCKTYVDRSSQWYTSHSRWAHAKPSLLGKLSSYQIVAAMSPWKTAKEILSKYHELMQYVWQWYNEVWGIPFLKGENRISYEDIMACVGTYLPITQLNPHIGHVSMGVDWGEHQSWVVISASGVNNQYPDRRCVIYVEEINRESLKANGYEGLTTDHVYRVRQLAEWFQVEILVNDANGLGTDRHQYLVNHLGDRVWGAFFDTAEMGRQLRHSKYLLPLWTPARQKVTFSKVFVFKELRNEFSRRFVTIPRPVGKYAKEINTFIRHQQALAVQPRFDLLYQREVEVVVKVSNEDHFLDGMLYSKIGWDKLVGSQGSVPAGV